MLISLTFFLNAAINFILGLAVAKVLGPEEFGRFAVASTVSTTLGIILFDWLRLSATQFYGETVRANSPDLRATLNAVYTGCTLLLALCTVLVLLFRVNVGLSPLLVVVVVVAAAATTRFEFWTALARARFLNTTYAQVIIVKNIAALTLMVGAGVIFHSATAVLVALTLSVVIALLPVQRTITDAQAPMTLARKERIAEFAHYGFPLVIASVIYQVILLLNRSIAASRLGYADAGQLSLATDLSLRLILAVGAGFDVFLFQLVVGKEATHGRDVAEKQVARNMLFVAAVLIPLAAGYAATMPSFTAVFIPAKYRSAFSETSLVLIPGILGYCLLQVGLSPVFQLVKRTSLLIWAALAALICYLLLLALVPRNAGVGAFALIHCASFAVGFLAVAAMALRFRACWPRIRDILAIVMATAAMVAAMWPTRGIAIPWIAFASAVITGTAVYALCILLFDIGGLRTILARITFTQRIFLNKLPQPDDTR